ncbi:MAG TPA: sortase [Candidatus Dojkabacteria bacterium]|jgi:LPXTG-site transpeptidase (sortase) family protein|nr:sortase [Candidatus Dojkabacteria bacterium]
MQTQNSWNIETESTKKIRKMRVTVSLLLATLGLVVVAGQALPIISSYIDGVITQKRAEVMVEPVPESYKTYIENEFAFYDPGQSYFSNLSKQFNVLGISTVSGNASSNKQTTQDIKIDQTYSKDMYITIPSIGIQNIKISPNVESDNEKVYNSFLKGGVAHFKGTPLPGDGGNSFIYGHSAVESFFSRHKDYPETIFSRLENIEIGEEVLITKDDTILKYVVRNKKIVSPDDFSVLQPKLNKETVTLMTCWPLGIGTKRLIVVAEKKI